MGTKLRKSIGALLENEYVASHSVVVGTGTAVSVMITAPSSGVATVYFNAQVTASLACDMVFSETPNASGGTAITSYHKDRDLTASANTAFVHTVTYTSAGTILENWQSNYSTPINISRYVLGSEKVYLIYLTAANADTSIDINCLFWED
jgi:hypothetical protein